MDRSNRLLYATSNCCPTIGRRYVATSVSCATRAPLLCDDVWGFIVEFGVVCGSRAIPKVRGLHITVCWCWCHKTQTIKPVDRSHLFPSHENNTLGAALCKVCMIGWYFKPVNFRAASFGPANPSTVSLKPALSRHQRCIKITNKY